jgi:hypothetical protein
MQFLEYLARAEDSQVRSGVANSILQIANAIPSDSGWKFEELLLFNQLKSISNLIVEEHFYKLLLRLGTSDRFGPRALSCEIFPFIYSRFHTFLSS